MSFIPGSEPTLSSRAMLCSLSISQSSASKHDRQASEEITVQHGAHPNVGRYNKLLIPKETLAEIRHLTGEAQREHYFMTLLWDDGRDAHFRRSPPYLNPPGWDTRACLYKHRIPPQFTSQKHVENPKQETAECNKIPDISVKKITGRIVIRYNRCRHQ